MNHLTIRCSRGITQVPPENIIRIQAISNYSKIYLTKGYPITVSKILQWFETQLPPQLFARVHRSHLVNKMFVQNVSGSQLSNLQLSNGENISISRRKKQVIRKTGGW